MSLWGYQKLTTSMYYLSLQVHYYKKDVFIVYFAPKRFRKTLDKILLI
jgi:hypothetical protein